MPKISLDDARLTFFTGKRKLFQDKTYNCQSCFIVLIASMILNFFNKFDGLYCLRLLHLLILSEDIKNLRRNVLKWRKVSLL
ncbi:hypothetical protein P5673_011155 [Acropora cervicornis]|uniref:Uncharacterized protein n=1 Tax=Acropora cervicornis TaxID=6130 RepID=A0AAD9QQF0_ACRCE|nr:hypothetical protein P5673_011155 [Acropora cervicornis]